MVLLHNYPALSGELKGRGLTGGLAQLIGVVLKMPSMEVLSSALHLLGKAIDPGSITEVGIWYSNVETDLPGDSSWRATVTLKGKKDLHNGSPDIVYDQSWSAEAPSVESALDDVSAQVGTSIEEFTKLRLDEVGFVQQATMTLHSLGGCAPKQ